MTVFYGKYDECRCIAHVPDMGTAYDTMRKFLTQRKINNYRFKTWTSPEKITTVEFGNPIFEFYVINRDAELKDEWILTSHPTSISMRQFEVE